MNEWIYFHYHLCLQRLHFILNIQGILEVNTGCWPFSPNTQSKECVILHTQTFTISGYWSSLFVLLRKSAQLWKVWSSSVPCPWRNCIAKQICVHSLWDYMFVVGVRCCVVSNNTLEFYKYLFLYIQVKLPSPLILLCQMCKISDTFISSFLGMFWKVQKHVWGLLHLSMCISLAPTGLIFHRFDFGVFFFY